jgi:hypothetical protein
MLLKCNLPSKSNMVDYNYIYNAHILLYRCPFRNNNTTPWFFDVSFYLLFIHIYMG